MIQKSTAQLALGIGFFSVILFHKYIQKQDF